ncbi:MAG TPA: hypothetical protein VN277_08625 [Acidiferrobacterales bacterium]|nr:hypothetical protein [Acidiferrobacterales bacterium]
MLRTRRSDHADKVPPSIGEPNLVFLVASQQAAPVTVALLNKQVRRPVRCVTEENAAIWFFPGDYPIRKPDCIRPVMLNTRLAYT